MEPGQKPETRYPVYYDFGSEERRIRREKLAESFRTGRTAESDAAMDRLHRRFFGSGEGNSPDESVRTLASLDSIKAAIDKLPPAEKEELFRYLLSQLPSGQTPPPRDYSVAQREAWIAEDEAAMDELRRKA